MTSGLSRLNDDGWTIGLKAGLDSPAGAGNSRSSSSQSPILNSNAKVLDVYFLKISGRKDTAMNRRGMFLILALLVTGCTTTETGAAVGGLGGATLGGIIGHQSGHGVAGAAIGGAAGTVGGMLVGEKMQIKFCPVCGSQYRDNVQFCPKDGTELKQRQ